MQERGLAAYLAELIGTFLLVFFITSVVVLFVSTGEQASFGSDFAVIGLVHAFLLFGLIVMFGVVSGGHFNPAVTLAAWAIKRICSVDALIYMLAQLSGGVLGALLCKGLLLDEGRATNYGAATVSGILGGNFQGAIIEAIGTFCLVLVILAAVFSRKSFKEWAPLAIGTTLGFIVMVGGPLDRRLLQPGALVRPGPGRQRVGRRLALPARPDRRLAARRGCLQVRARAGGPCLRPSRPSRSGRPAAEVLRGRALIPDSCTDRGAVRSRAVAVACQRAPGHLLAELHALPLAHLPVLLQVLRVCDSSGPYPLA